MSLDKSFAKLEKAFKTWKTNTNTNTLYDLEDAAHDFAAEVYDQVADED